MVRYFTNTYYASQHQKPFGFWLVFVQIFVFVFQLSGQSDIASNKFSKSFLLDVDTIIYVQNTISPSSILITGSQNHEYQIGRDYFVDNKSIKFTKPTIPDSILLQFRSLDFDLFSAQAMIDSSNIQTDDRVIRIKPSGQNSNLYNRRFIQSSKLQYSGSFSRGLAFGNTQDVVLNSSFNLQMQGDLGNGLMVRAAISDENIPIQPEGNTQVLQEFDKIFIEISKDRTSVIAGDYEIASPDGYFMKYYKKLKGFSVSNVHSIDEKWSVENKGSFAVSRGKFRRQMLDIVEGNQGPYRLIGANGEVFLQVLSGTEKVYADGVLLTRGEKNDYVIDYNRAEISFTPNLIVRENLRIIVEFEYAVQSYLRSLVATSSTIRNDRFAFDVNLYHEQDSKTLSSNLEFDSLDIAALRESGDQPAFRSGIVEEIPDVDGVITYRYNGQFLEYEPRDTAGLVTAVFTNVGQGKGDYIIDSEAGANGRVYKYVGENGGSYTPNIQIVPPEVRQLITLSGKYLISDSTSVFIESGLSNRDFNRFSTVDDADNKGISLFTEVKDVRKLSREGQWTLSSVFNLESSEADFRALNPYRNAEFIRDWSVETPSGTGRENLLNLQTALRNKQQEILYRLSTYSNGEFYAGNRHIGQYQLNDQVWNIRLKGNFLNAKSDTEDIVFNRPIVDISRRFFNNSWRLGIHYEKEQNIREDLFSDSLNLSSINYDLYRIFVEKPSGENLDFKFYFSERFDDRVNEDANAMQAVTRSKEYGFGGRWQYQMISNLEWQLVIRDFSVENNFETSFTPSKAFIGNIDHELGIFKRGIVLQSYFESNSGQEPKFEFQYIQVQKGEGSYSWIDYNMDSLQQINEFVIAPFSDQADYEKLTVFNNEFISTNRVILNQSIRIDPRQFVKGPQAFAKKILLTARYRIDQKSNSASDDRLLKFVNWNFNDTSLVSYNAGADVNLFVNRGDPDWDTQFSYRLLDNKLVLISGAERRSKREWYNRSRINVVRQLDYLMETSFGNKQSASENFLTQNYNVAFFEISPKFNYRPKSNMRVVLKYALSRQTNQTGDEENATSNTIGGEFTWRQARNSNFELRFDYVAIDYEGDRNTPVEFEMLQGLKAGKNILWNINYTRRIANNIDIIVNYEGRKSEDSRLVNIAGVQMRAIF